MERHWLVLFILVSIRLALAQTDVSVESSSVTETPEPDALKVTEKPEIPPSSESAIPSNPSSTPGRPSIYLFKSPSSIKTVHRVKQPETSSDYALPWNAHTTQEVSTPFPTSQDPTTVTVNWFQHPQEQQRIPQQEQQQVPVQVQQQHHAQQYQPQKQEHERIPVQQQHQVPVQVQQQQQVQQYQPQKQEQERAPVQQQQQVPVQVQQQHQVPVQVQQQQQVPVQVQQQQQYQPQSQEQERLPVQQQQQVQQYQPQNKEKERIPAQQQQVQVPQQQKQEQIPQFQPVEQDKQQEQQVQLQQQQEQQRLQLQEKQEQQKVQLQQQQQEQLQHYKPQQQENPTRQQQIQQQYQQRIQYQQQQRLQQQQQHQQQIQQQQRIHQQQRQPLDQFSNKQFKASSIKTAVVPSQENLKVPETNNDVDPKGKVPFNSQASEAERLKKADQALDQFFNDVLANLSVKMQTGMDEPLGEILDPVRLDDMQLQPLVAGEVFDVKMKKISVGGLSDYKITQLESQLNESRIKISIHYPKLTANCLFGANGTMYEIFKVTGKGNATIIFNEVHARTVLYLTKDNGVLQVASADQPYVDFSSAEILFKDEEAAEDSEPVKAESVATQLGPLYFWVLTANAVDKIDYPLALYFNKALKEFPLSDFLDGHIFRQRHLRIHVPSHPLPYAYVAADLTK